MADGCLTAEIITHHGDEKVIQNDLSADKTAVFVLLQSIRRDKDLYRMGINYLYHFSRSDSGSSFMSPVKNGYLPSNSVILRLLVRNVQGATIIIPGEWKKVSTGRIVAEEECMTVSDDSQVNYGRNCIV